VAEQNILTDGTADWSLGQDAWHSPDRIAPNQYWKGINVSTRGGFLSPRARYCQLQLTFEDKRITTSYGYSRTIADIWTAGKFQAFIYYNQLPDEYLITVVCGLIYRTNIRNGKTILMSEDIKVNQYRPRINWSYAAGSIVIFDFPNYPVIITGDDVMRSDPNNVINGFSQPQVPISTMGTYNQNRLFVANEGTEFTAGDPVGNLLTPEAPLTFTEVLTPSSPFYRQFFTLDTFNNAPTITAMGFIQQLDSNTGIGPMFVSTEDNLFFYNTNQPRDAWTQGQFGGLLLANAGVIGPRAIVNVNSDLLFLSAQGKVHALSAARAESKRWGNVPISREVEVFLRTPEHRINSYATLGYFNNRIYISANPYRIGALDREARPVSDYAFGGFVVMELDNLSSFLSEGSPTWSGLWTGINPMDIINTRDKCFVISKDYEVANAIYEITDDIDTDIAYGLKRQVRSVVYTKEYEFENPFTQKREHNLVLQTKNLAGKIKIIIERKPSHSSKFLLWDTWEYEAPIEACDIPCDEFLKGLANHELKEIIFGDAEEQGCSPITGDVYNTFLKNQLRIIIQGDYWELDHVKFSARLVEFLERPTKVVCGKLPVQYIEAPCDSAVDWAIPTLSRCET